MSRDFDVISLDLETSGSEVDRHTILSVGCVRLSDMTSFYSEVRHESFEVSPEASRIHRIDLTTRDDKKLPKMAQVDENLRTWLKGSKFFKEGKRFSLIPMGMNVAAFDMKFVQKYLPKSAALFGRRSMDLNAVLFVDALMHGHKFETTKKAAKTLGHSFALHHVPDREAHDALFDAWSNIGVLHYVVDDVSGEGAHGRINWEGGNLDE